MREIGYKGKEFTAFNGIRYKIVYSYTYYQYMFLNMRDNVLEGDFETEQQLKNALQEYQTLPVVNE